MSQDPEVSEVYAAKDLTSGGKVFSKMSPPARLAVLGDPVAHSASPLMHNAALQAGGRKLQYVRIHVTPEELPESLKQLSSADFIGASLTIPHKQAALSFMDHVSREADLMGAINTVAVRDGKLHGYNTDGPGLSSAIHESFDIPLKELRVLILGGAGGAGRAITVQCAIEGCPRITIANRNRKKGDALAREIEASIRQQVTSITLSQAELSASITSADLIINATPLGMKEGDPSPLPEGLLTKNHLVYDTVYSGGETALLKQARMAGARCAGGFSMLLHQGALQNSLWFGEAAPLETMRKALADLRR